MNACLIAIAITATLGAGVVSSQDYPTKPVRIFTGSAGGGGDFVSRIVAQGISGPLGQPVIVDNRANLAADALAKAPPDGYTLLINGGGAVWIRPLLTKIPYDAARDFAPISLLVKEINLLVVHPSLPVKSAKELIALAKSRPRVLNYSSSGVGSTNHLGMELFKTMAGVDIVHVPYKGGAGAITSLISGEVQVLISDMGFLIPHVKANRLKALGVTTAQPSALVPGLPTVSATGLPGYEAVSMTGTFVPVKTPEAIIRRLSQEIRKLLSQPDVREKFFNAGVEVVGSSPEELAAAGKAETTKWGKVIKDAGISAE